MSNENSNQETETGPADANAADASSTKSAAELECEQLKDRLARTLAEFQNFRKNAEKRQIELRKFVIKDVIFQMLPIVDNFGLALAALDQGQSLDQVKEGVRFIHDMMLKFLSDQRVEVIPAIGHDFDPAQHEVVSCETSADHAPNSIIREVQRGYRIEDVIIRHARVAVAVAPPEGGAAKKS